MLDSAPGTRSRFWIVRTVLICIGVGLVAWALADDTMIGGEVGLGKTQILVAALGVVAIVASLLPKPIASSALALFVSLLVSLVIAELVLSATLRARYYSAFDFDERALFSLRPGATREFTHIPANGGETIVYHINSDGYRGPELLPAGERFRVIVYGDSFIQAEFTNQEDTFAAKLQEELSARFGKEVEVINGGVAGYGPDQILRRMETDLDTLKPDFVLFSIFAGNDFGDLLRNRLYRLGPSGELIENEYEMGAYQQRQIELSENELVLVRVFRETLKALSGRGEDVYEFDRAGWIDGALEQHLREYNEYVVENDNTVGTFAVDPYSVDIAVSPNEPSARYKVELMDQIVSKISEQLDSRSIPYHAMVIPHPMDLLDGDHESGFMDRTKFPEYDPKRLTETAATILDGHNIPYTNLFEVFQTGDPSSLYLGGGDDHWNEMGQALAAQEIAKELTITP